jgi:N-acetylglucosamine-6-phosphate deacetylase
MIFTNGRLVFPDRIEEGLSLRVEGGRITALYRQVRSAGEEVLDLKETFLAPDFIDLHVHGAIGRDTMEGTERAFRAICDYHLGGGTTSLLLTTVSRADSRDCAVVRQIDSARASIPQLRGAHVEGPFLLAEKARGASARNTSSCRRPILFARCSSWVRPCSG